MLRSSVSPALHSMHDQGTKVTAIEQSERQLLGMQCPAPRACLAASVRDTAGSIGPGLLTLSVTWQLMTTIFDIIQQQEMRTLQSTGRPHVLNTAQ